jgi:hypothetical protein
MSSYCIRSRRTVTRGLGIAAALLAGIALSPTVASADDEAATSMQRTAEGQLASVDGAGIVLHRSAQPDLRLDVDADTHVAKDGEKASISDLRQGEPVRASYEETNGVARATRIEAKRGAEPSNVQTVNPDDPEWNSLHSGG